MNPSDVNHWLDVNPKPTQPLNSVCKPQNQPEFLRIVAERCDYTYNGLNLIKHPSMDVMEAVKIFFAKFEVKDHISTMYGGFTKKNFNTFIKNQLECQRSHKEAMYRKDAKRTLVKLMESLSTIKVDQRTGRVYPHLFMELK